MKIYSGLLISILLIFSQFKPSEAQAVFKVQITDTVSVTCPGYHDGKIKFYVRGGVPPYNYRITKGGGADTSLKPADNTFEQGNLQGGKYSLYVADGVGHKDTIQFGIHEPEPFEFEYIKEKVRCHGESNGALTVNVKGGTGYYSYGWNLLGARNGNFPNDKSIENLKAGQYEISVEDRKGCRATDTAKVNEPAPLTLNLKKDNVTCHGHDNGVIYTEASGGNQGLSCPYYYEISNSDSLFCSGDNEKFNFTGLPADTYQVKVIDDKGCEKQKSIVIEQPPELEIAVDSLSHVSCFNGQNGYIKLNTEGGTPPYSYDWNNPNLRHDSFILRNLTADTYNVHVTDQNACSKFFYKAIREPDQRFIQNFPEVIPMDTNHKKLMTYGIRIDSAIDNYSWSPDKAISCVNCRNPEVYPKQDRLYTIEITDLNGCSFKDSTFIDILEEPELFVPNAFTPDGDRLNDVFKPKVAYKRVIKDYQMKIYNQWGEMVYESEQIENGWGGRKNGVKSPIGTYHYIIKGQYFNGEGFEKSGEVKLIR